MTISAYQSPAGRKGWKVTVDLPKDPVTDRRRRMSRICWSTKADARQLEATMRLSGQMTATHALTVGQMIERWLEQVGPELSPTTILGYRSKIDQYLIPNLGDLPVEKLTAARIDALYRKLAKEGVRGRPLSPATIRRVHAALSSACGQAVKWGWLPANPCDRSTPPRQVRREIDPPSLEQILAVVEHADVELRDAVGLAIATGARRGELCGVQWADVDLDQMTVTFRRSVGSIGTDAVVIEDRRKSSIRTVAIDTVTVDMLKARRARAAEAALEHGLPLVDESYVLGDLPGQREPLAPQTLSHRWRTAAKAAGVNARLHDVRHFHVTALLSEGVSVPNVVTRAGWASPQMLRVYAHAVEKVDRQAADVIGRKLAGN